MAVAMGASFILGGTAFAQSNAVVYFTLKHNRLGVENAEQAIGNTQRVAQEIAKQTQADTFELETRQTYLAQYRQTTRQAQQELENNTQVELVSIPDISSYDTVYIGFPN